MPGLTPKVSVTRWLVVLVALAILQAVVDAGWISKLILAAPTTIVVHVIADLGDSQFLTLIATTLYETTVSFVICTLGGVALGYWFWRRPVWGEAYDPLIGGLLASPLILLYPVFLVLFGRTPTAIIAQAVVLGILPVILYSRAAFNGVGVTLLRVGRSMNLSYGMLFRHILLPAAAPTIFTGIRLGLTYILISVVAMEYIVEIGGLGKAVAQMYMRFEVGELYSAIVYVVLISVLFIHLTYRIENALRR